MKKILVPCDFSEQAINAFRVAVDIAEQSKGEVHLLYVIELPVIHDSALMPVLSFEEALFKELQDKTNGQFKKLIAKYGKDAARIKTKLVYGGPSLMILNYINEADIDLVVMGTKGASGIKEIIVGSNTERIVRNSPAPVLVIKKYTKVGAVKNIVFPNAFDHEQEDLTMQVKVLQNFFKAKLNLVYINTPNNFQRDVVTMKRLKEFAKRFMLKDYTINVFNDPYEESGIINFAHMVNAEMIAMGTHGRKGLSHILSGSVTEDVVNHVDIPIWTYTFKKKR